MTLAEALRYQQELDAAQRPAYGNPNLAAQGRNANVAERSRAFPFMQAADAQFAKEKSSLSDPRATTDLINKGFLAGLGGAPVDLINMGLTPLGMGSAFPFGGSEHIKRAMEDYGVATPTERPIFEGITSLTPPRAVMGAARFAGQGAEAAGKALAPVAGQALENYMVRTGGILPMDTWHGSPHRFPPTAKNPLGEFDPMKIGTGEGTQAYGAGAGYLAESPKVAKSYKQTEGAYKRVTGGMTNKQEFVADHLSQGRPEINILEMYAQKYGGSFDDAMKDLISVKEMYGSGNLYKVDLPDEQIAKMLDWDKPLSQQSAEVQAALQAALKANRDAFGGLSGHVKFNSSDITGADLYKNMRTAKGEQKSIPGVGYEFGDFGASDKLRELGIPGIRYLDQGSRAGGEGTSNFVVFDPKHMNILERDGVTAESLRKVSKQDEISRLAQQLAAFPIKENKTMRLFHRSPEETLEQVKENEGRFNGIFAGDDPESAIGLSPRKTFLYHTDIPESAIADSTILINKSETKTGVTNSAIKNSINSKYHQRKNIDAIKDVALNDKNIYEMIDPDTNKPTKELQQILKALGTDDLGEASWELQKIRGSIAKELGFKAVTMDDEQGLSYFLTPGTKLKAGKGE